MEPRFIAELRNILESLNSPTMKAEITRPEPALSFVVNLSNPEVSSRAFATLVAKTDFNHNTEYNTRMNLTFGDDYPLNDLVRELRTYGWDTGFITNSKNNESFTLVREITADVHSLVTVVLWGVGQQPLS